jgi:hypothetical protein
MLAAALFTMIVIRLAAMVIQFEFRLRQSIIELILRQHARSRKTKAKACCSQRPTS